MKFGLIKLIYHLLYYTKVDLFTGRARGVIFLGLANLLPDLYCFGYIRPFFWRMAGVKLKDLTSSFIRQNTVVEKPRNLIIGKRFQINTGSYIDASGQVIIGDDVTLSLGCKILTISHSGASHEKDIILTTALKNNCIIYAGAIVLPGALVREYVVVAAGSVLKGDTKPGGVYAGVPAKFKGYRKDIDNNLFQLMN